MMQYSSVYRGRISLFIKVLQFGGHANVQLKPYGKAVINKFLYNINSDLGSLTVVHHPI